MSRNPHFVALVLTLGLHSGVWLWVSDHPFKHVSPTKAPQTAENIVFLELMPLPPQPLPKPPSAPSFTPADTPTTAPNSAPPTEPAAPAPLPSPDRPRASMAAPPPPSAEEWAFAAKYTLKNSKGYRYSWGQQVRSLMGTALEGPDQGLVRFRIEIAPRRQPDTTANAVDHLRQGRTTRAPSHPKHAAAAAHPHGQAADF